jgi:hypothetical protein
MGMELEEYFKEAPALTREDAQAIEAWSFCEGWHPERIPFAAAWLNVRDVDLLTAQLLAIRATFARAREAEQEEPDA